MSVMIYDRSIDSSNWLSITVPILQESIPLYQLEEKFLKDLAIFWSYIESRHLSRLEGDLVETVREAKLTGLTPDLAALASVPIPKAKFSAHFNGSIKGPYSVGNEFRKQDVQRPTAQPQPAPPTFKATLALVMLSAASSGLVVAVCIHSLHQKDLAEQDELQKVIPLKFRRTSL